MHHVTLWLLCLVQLLRIYGDPNRVLRHLIYSRCDLPLLTSSVVFMPEWGFEHSPPVWPSIYPVCHTGSHEKIYHITFQVNISHNAYFPLQGHRMEMEKQCVEGFYRFLPSTSTKPHLPLSGIWTSCTLNMRRDYPEHAAMPSLRWCSYHLP